MELLTRIGPQRLAAMGAVTLALVAFFAFVTMRVTQPAMGVLYSELALQDAGAIVRELETRGVQYETRADGQTILVPRNEIGRLRMELAAKGMPAGGNVGYEIFDKGDAFSSTSFVQNVNRLRALEGELARTIRSLARVESARVHLVLPERRLFERETEAPRASIVLKLRGELDSGQIQAISHLAASAVPGLEPKRISIVDERGRLLADGARDDEAMAGLAADGQQSAVERRLERQIEEIVADVVGPGRARVQVSAELDFNRIESRSESFDPESRVVRSTQTRSETSSTTGAEGAVSVGNELPGANQNQNAAGPRDQQEKNEEIINYEISRTTRTEVVAPGRLKRLSVAVLVDGVHTPGPDGQSTYAPRTEEELERIATLVRTAIGFDRNRGDQVEVVNLRFAEGPQVADTGESSLMDELFSPTKEDILRAVELAVIALLTLIVLLTVVRPMVRRIVGPDSAKRARGGGSQTESTGSGSGAPALPPAESASAKMIEIAKVNGQLQQDSLQRVGELVKSNPAETVSVLRQWIHERA